MNLFKFQLRIIAFQTGLEFNKRSGIKWCFSKDPYIKGLMSIVSGDSDQLFMDRLIIASVAELRGSERFKLIGEVCDDKKIARFYSNLHLQELEHIDSFIKWLKFILIRRMLTIERRKYSKKKRKSLLLFLGEVQFIEVNKRIGVVM